MRFGLFIPQGWRMDLVGIDPADQWATMNGLVTRADAGATFESVWVYDHFHTVPEPTQDGRYFQVDGARVYPQPLQKPHIPLWIAGGGERKTLRIAAQHAQYTNFDGSADGFAHKSAVLEGHCRDIGRDFDAITRSANYNVVIGRTEAEVEDR